MPGLVPKLRPSGRQWDDPRLANVLSWGHVSRRGSYVDPSAVCWSCGLSPYKPLLIGVWSIIQSLLALTGLGIHRNTMSPLQDALQPWMTWGCYKCICRWIFGTLREEARVSHISAPACCGKPGGAPVWWATAVTIDSTGCRTRRR